MVNPEGLRIYNIYPKACGNITQWIKKLNKIKEMDFSHIFINPIFEMGYSKNLYAPKDFFKIDSSFCDDEVQLNAEEQIGKFLKNAHDVGLRVVLELIFTHTALDSDLLMTHPEWFKNENGVLKKYSVRDMDRWIELPDLIEIDNWNNANKATLIEYWKSVIDFYLDMGFNGFKIETAYKIPADMLKELINYVRRDRNNIIFIGENLGATEKENIELAHTGFDYMFTSLKWWDLSSSWFLEQIYEIKHLVKLVSFPEYHNTKRIAEIYNGNIYASKAWFALSSLITSAVMIPAGYEDGCFNRIDNTDFDEMESEKRFDLREYISMINSIKKSYNIFNKEGSIYLVNLYISNILALKKILDDKSEEALIIINMNFSARNFVNIEKMAEYIKKSEVISISADNKVVYCNTSTTLSIDLSPGEVRIFHGS